VDESHAGKESILAELLQLRDWKPADLRIVGDSETNEIAAGIRLQIPTIQILRPGIQKAETASRHIMTLLELL
jgi:FMN phosphatase YigB (HAD superfamily)